jgi:uncharacterized protein YqhQ
MQSRVKDSTTNKKQQRKTKKNNHCNGHGCCCAVAMIGFIFILFFSFFFFFFFFVFVVIFPYQTPPYFPWTPQLIGDHEAGRSENVRVTLAASPLNRTRNEKKKRISNKNKNKNGWAALTETGDRTEKIETFPRLLIIIYFVYTEISFLSLSIVLLLNPVFLLPFCLHAHKTSYYLFFHFFFFFLLLLLYLFSFFCKL